MRFYFYASLLVFLALCGGAILPANAQSPGNGRVTGTVFDAHTKQPLGFATVFIAQTTYGTNAQENGTFQLPVLPTGSHELVVSFLGYETLTHAFTLAPGAQMQFRFELQPKANALQEVVVRADTNWRHNYAMFLKQFIGQTANAAQTRILNPEVLHFTFSPENNAFTAEAAGALIIENKALGYRLHYLLKNFELDFKNGRVFHAGYPRFEAMKGSRARQKRYANARLKAYHGSLMHFVRTLQANSLAQEGFNVRWLQRLPNPHRPAEAEIQRGIKTWRGQGKTIVISQNGVKDDSLQYWIQMSRLPKTVEYLYKDPVRYDQILQFDQAEERFKLQFPDYLNVVYTREKEEPGFLRQSLLAKPRAATFQTSLLYLTAPFALLDRNGAVLDPNTHMVEGYWAWEKMAEMLPLDYQPPAN